MTESEKISQQRRVAKDLARWRDELAMASKEDFDADALFEYMQWVLEMDEDERKSYWMESVGEWVLSRHDVDIEGDAETWLDAQYENIKAGEPVPWGYITDISDVPFVVGQRVRLDTARWESSTDELTQRDGEEGDVLDVLEMQEYEVRLDDGTVLNIPSHKALPVTGTL